MKKIILIAASIVFFLHTAAAQQIKETFENNTFRWEDIVEKKKSAMIEGNHLKLEVQKKYDPVKITTRFPLNVQEKFKITVTFKVPKLSDDISFGFWFDYKEVDGEVYETFEEDKKAKEEKNMPGIQVRLTEDYFRVIGNGIEERGKIKLPKGKDQTVTFTLESQGGKQVYKVNNMTAANTKQELTSPYCGFYLTSYGGKAEVFVEEIVIDQVQSEE